MVVKSEKRKMDVQVTLVVCHAASRQVGDVQGILRDQREQTLTHLSGSVRVGATGGKR